MLDIASRRLSVKNDTAQRWRPQPIERPRSLGLGGVLDLHRPPKSRPPIVSTSQQTHRRKPVVHLSKKDDFFTILSSSSLSSPASAASPAMAFRAVVPGRLILVLLVIASSCLECKVTGCHDEERRDLLELKRSINFPNVSTLSYWGYSTTKEEKDCCRWEGITCDSNTGHVVGIDLSFQQFQLTSCSNLTMLTVFGQLETLNLGFNHITGGIPEGNFP